MQVQQMLCDPLKTIFTEEKADYIHCLFIWGKVSVDWLSPKVDYNLGKSGPKRIPAQGPLTVNSWELFQSFCLAFHPLHPLI